MTFRTSGLFDHDPTPYVDDNGLRHWFPVDLASGRYALDPRPEYDHHNPVLKRFRADDVEWKRFTSEQIREEVRMIEHPEWRIIWETEDATEQDRAHAIRVLNRLAYTRQEKENI